MLLYIPINLRITFDALIKDAPNIDTRNYAASNYFLINYVQNEDSTHVTLIQGTRNKFKRRYKTLTTQMLSELTLIPIEARYAYIATLEVICGKP